MAKDLKSLLTGELLDEDMELTLAEFCQTCRLPAERVYELVEEGIIDPLGRDPSRWRFRWISVRRVQCALRLEHDLGVNLAGAALALDLLEELEALRTRLHGPD
jgi:chaperone modulatory protein CbpM